jgi:hypothetical protein
MTIRSLSLVGSLLLAVTPACMSSSADPEEMPPEDNTPDDNPPDDMPEPPPTGIGGAWAAENSNTAQSLLAVWAADIDNIWAVGTNGTAVFRSGTHWQVRPTNTTHALTDINGTSAANIFAITSHEVLQWTGSSWNKTTTGLTEMSCIRAVDDTTALVGWFDKDSFAEKAYAVLAKFENGTLTELGRQPVPGFWVSARSCKLESLGDGTYALGIRDQQNLYGGKIYVWDGTSLVDKVTNATPFMYAADESHIFLEFGANVIQWDGATTFPVLNTGYGGNIVALTGNSATRVFALGNSNPPGDSAMQSSDVLFYDGIGWITEALPRTVSDARMQAIYALPTGEVVAAGENGLLFLKGRE